MSDDPIKVEIDGGVMTITLNRPKAKNAVNQELAQRMVAALDELDENPELSVAIITGADNTFCSGMDLKAFVKGESPSIEGRGFAGITMRPPQKPVIAAIEGYAIAGGFEIALSCDLIFAASNAKFGISEVKRGLVASAGGLMKLPRQVPPRIAMQMALTGDFIDADRAFDIGLINEVVEPGTALEAAKKIASTISSNAPLATKVCKQVITQSADWLYEEMWTKQRAMIEPVFKSEDAREGATAFAEKRQPVWKGK